MATSNVTRRVVQLSEAGAMQGRAVDAALAERCRRGELDAFEDLYRQHATRLYNLSVRMLGNAADAEDAVQDTFLVAHRRLDSFRGDSALGTWLYRLAVNQCIDRLRSRSTRDLRATDSIDEPERAWLQPAARGDRPNERLDLEQAIAKLPEG